MDAEPRVRRRAGRVLPVVDDPERGPRVLLLRGGDPGRPADGHWWFTVGGGCEGDEPTMAAARREAAEEAGLRLPVELGPVVLHRTAQFDFEGVAYTQVEDFYLCRVGSDAVRTDGWTDVERRSVTAWRWWSLAELEALGDDDEPVYPEQLAALLRRLLDGRDDAQPAAASAGQPAERTSTSEPGIGRSSR